MTKAFLAALLVAALPLLYSAPALANACDEGNPITVRGTIVQIIPQPYNAVLPGQTYMVSDPTLDCSPVQVFTDPDTSCAVGDSVVLDGTLDFDADKNSWMLMSDDFPVYMNNQFACSVH